MDTTAQHIATRDDEYLRARLVAAAEQAGIPQAESFVQMNIGKLVSIKIGGDTTITAIHAYTSAQRSAALAAIPPAPGLDPAAITDPNLAAAISAVWSPAAGNPSA